MLKKGKKNLIAYKKMEKNKNKNKNKNKK